MGINLCAADTCILFDSDWNPHQDSQASTLLHYFFFSTCDSLFLALSKFFVGHVMGRRWEARLPIGGYSSFGLLCILLGTVPPGEKDPKSIVRMIVPTENVIYGKILWVCFSQAVEPVLVSNRHEQAELVCAVTQLVRLWMEVDKMKEVLVRQCYWAFLGTGRRLWVRRSRLCKMWLVGGRAVG